MGTVEGKEERLQIRVDAADKRRLQQAAEYSEQKLSQFVLCHALKAAEEVIARHQTLTLSERDWTTFLDALEHPPEPNEALKQAFARHRRSVR